MVKSPAANAGISGDAGLIPGLGRSPGGGNGNPLQYLCLENLMDRGAWWVTVYGVTKSQTQLSDSVYTKNFQNGTYSNGFIMNNDIHLIYFIEKSTLLVRLEL